MVAPSSKFYGKIWVGFCLNTEKQFFVTSFILNPTKTAYVIFKKSAWDIQNIPPLEKSAWFYVTITGNFERFQYFNLETNFMENLFQKAVVPLFRWKCKENASFELNWIESLYLKLAT